MTMKVILKLDYANDKTKQKAMKKVSGLSGVESIALDAKGKKLTVSGAIDPIDVVAKLRKICYTDIVSVGPAKDKEPEKEAAEGKKDEPQNKDDAAAAKLLSQAQQPYYFQPQPAAAVGLPASYPTYYHRSDS